MKRTRKAVVVLAAALALVSCGNSNNVCGQAADIIWDGLREGCTGQTGCCFCTCLQQGKMFDPMQQTCTCIPGDPTGSSGECTAEEQQQAQACIDDAAACKANASQSVTQVCGIS